MDRRDGVHGTQRPGLGDGSADPRSRPVTRAEPGGSKKFRFLPGGGVLFLHSAGKNDDTIVLAAEDSPRRAPAVVATLLLSGVSFVFLGLQRHLGGGTGVPRVRVFRSFASAPEGRGRCCMENGLHRASRDGGATRRAVASYAANIATVHGADSSLRCGRVGRDGDGEAWRWLGEQEGMASLAVTKNTDYLTAIRPWAGCSRSAGCRSSRSGGTCW